MRKQHIYRPLETRKELNNVQNSNRRYSGSFHNYRLSPSAEPRLAGTSRTDIFEWSDYGGGMSLWQKYNSRWMQFTTANDLFLSIQLQLFSSEADLQSFESPLQLLNFVETLIARDVPVKDKRN